MLPNDEDAAREAPVIEAVPDENDGALPALSIPQVMLTGLMTPLPVLWGITLPFGLLLAFLGHPWIGLIATVGNMAGDWVAQGFYQRWSPTIESADEAVAVRRISLVVFFRGAIAMFGPVAAVMSTDAPADLMFAGLMACMLLCVAVAQGSLSRRLFWMSASPVVAGLGLLIIARFPPGQAAALLGATGMLAVMLTLLAGGMTRILGEWAIVRERNNRLIERLRAERAEAERAREEARLAGEAKASFLATMSHEIRTPMNGVLGMAQLLKRSAADEEQTRRIDTLIHSGEFLMSILNDILDISKIDAGRMEVAVQPEDLRTVLEDIGRLWRPTAEEKGLDLIIEVAADAPAQVAMDAQRLRQVLFNLFGNALKFTSAGSVSLTVGHRPLSDGRVELQIALRDTGIGIDPAALPGLFERFSQADQSISRRFGGAGLGLAISSRLTELMGGRIWAESTPGQGSCFHLALPVAVASGESPAPAINDRAPPSATAEAAGRLSILVVDDNQVNLMVLDQILSALGHRCVCAGGGPEALEVAAIQPFDLILLDIRMPGMSGIETLGALRAAPGPNRSTRALAVTADVLTRGHGDYISLGFSGHVSKPIQVASLVAEINLALSAEDPASAAA